MTTTKTTNNQLPEISVSSNLYTVLKIVFLIAVCMVICINVLGASASLPPNTTDWNWGTVEDIDGSVTAYPDGYYNDEGIPNGLTDDDLEELEELRDEEQHEEESDEYDDRDE